MKDNGNGTCSMHETDETFMKNYSRWKLCGEKTA